MRKKEDKERKTKKREGKKEERIGTVKKMNDGKKKIACTGKKKYLSLDKVMKNLVPKVL